MHVKCLKDLKEEIIKKMEYDKELEEWETEFKRYIEINKRSLV